MLQLLQKMYDQMKDEPRFLIDYKTFTSTIDEMKATAESLNGSHANDVFLVAIEEFRGKLMKRKEAKAKVQERMERLDEMNDGDEAKALLFFITRNLSVLNCYVEREGCEKLLDAVAACLKAAVGRGGRGV